MDVDSELPPLVPALDEPSAGTSTGVISNQARVKESAKKSNHAKQCAFCLKPATETGLKPCDQCRLVSYCSRKCKKAAYKTHKKSCAASANLRNQMDDDPAIQERNHDLSEWLSYWRPHLYTMGIYAMDLANHPANRLATHVPVITLEYRPNPPSRSQIFRMDLGGVMSRDEFVSLMKDHDCTDDVIEDFVTDNRGAHTIQVSILCEGTMRFLFLSFRSLYRWQAMDKQQSRNLAESWVPVLKEMIEKGDSGDLAKSAGFETLF